MIIFLCGFILGIAVTMLWVSWFVLPKLDDAALEINKLRISLMHASKSNGQ